MSYFNPRPPRGERRCKIRQREDWTTNFNPRPPRGERRLWIQKAAQQTKISIHALREESDTSTKTPVTLRASFQSTPSARRATLTCCSRSSSSVISIHALREESDGKTEIARTLIVQFQSTPSARRATSNTSYQRAVADIFQSTPSARRATPERNNAYRHPADFNPRPPRGERPWLLGRRYRSTDISIHALREESDSLRPGLGDEYYQFQSTPSARRATFLALL